MITRTLSIRRPNFMNGMARVLDLGSTLNVYQYNDEAENIDFFAINSDWATIGEDMKKAINLYQWEIYGK
jgi:hypothetical protein